jgi:hypothetical protein
MISARCTTLAVIAVFGSLIVNAGAHQHGFEYFNNPCPGQRTLEDFVEPSVAACPLHSNVVIAAAIGSGKIYGIPVMVSTDGGVSWPAERLHNVMLYDVLGRIVAIPFSEFKSNGRHTISIGTEDLPCGYYRVNVLVNGHLSGTGTITVAR